MIDYKKHSNPSLRPLSMPLCGVTLQDFLQEAEPLPHLCIWAALALIGGRGRNVAVLGLSLLLHTPCMPLFPPETLTTPVVSLRHRLACCVLAGTCCCPQNLRSELLVDWKLATDALPNQTENRSADAQKR